MQNKVIEQILQRIGSKYRAQIWNNHNHSLIQDTNITPLKKPKVPYGKLIQHKYQSECIVREQKKEKEETFLNRPRLSKKSNQSLFKLYTFEIL